MEQKFEILHINLSTESVRLETGSVHTGYDMPDYKYNHMEFREQFPTFGESLVRAIPGLAAIILLVFGAGIWGFNNFVKCDIRREI